MQVSVEKINTIARKIHLTISSSKINEEFNNKIKEFSKNVKLNGFRQGHVPIKLIKEKYGFSIYQEVVKKLLDSNVQEALTNYELEPIGEININKFENDFIDLEHIKDLNCTFELEVYPTIEFNDFKDLTIKTPEVNIGPEEVAKNLLELRAKFGTFIEVDRPSQKGDVITIDFVGTIDGKTFDGGVGEDLKLEIGSNIFIDGFESGLIGSELNNTVTLELNFPEEYADAFLAAKQVTFKVTVKKIEEKKLAEVDTNLAKNLNITDEDINKIEDQIKDNLQQYVKILTKEIEYKAIKEMLIQTYPIELSDKLINAEFESLKRAVQADNQKQGINIKEFNNHFLAKLKASAIKNVHLFLLLRSIIKQNHLKANENLLREKLHEFDENFKDFKDFKKMRAYLHNSIINSNLTDVALEFVDKKVRKISEPMSFENLIKFHSD